MEYAGAASEANRESLSFGSASTVPLEEYDVIAQLFGNGLFSSETHHELNLETPSMYWPDYDGSSTHHSSSDVSSNDQYYWGQQGVCASGTTSHFVQPNLEFEKHYLNDPNAVLLSNAGFIPMETCMGDGKCDATELLLDEPACFIDESTSNGSGESNVNPLELTSSHDRKPPPKRRLAVVEKERSSHGSPQKKVKRNTKNAQSKRTQKNKKNCETEEENVAISTCSSEDESCESQETNGDGGRVSSSSKSRARRGSATDPQSLYARKRRERINERLKILQNLVPNGTKVDISTMLEEAVQYVKFLQVQIKLLSSDDLWMYAPIAYNGMNIGLDLKISPSQ